MSVRDCRIYLPIVFSFNLSQCEIRFDLCAKVGSLDLSDGDWRVIIFGCNVLVDRGGGRERRHLILLLLGHSFLLHPIKW